LTFVDSMLDAWMVKNRKFVWLGTHQVSCWHVYIFLQHDTSSPIHTHIFIYIYIAENNEINPTVVYSYTSQRNYVKTAKE